MITELPSASLASCRIEAAGGGAVDNSAPQGFPLLKANFCPN